MRDHGYDIFLSYASEDQRHAREIATRLRASEIKVFIDYERLQPGFEFDSTIASAIAKSDVFVFLASKHSVKAGKYTLSELAVAELTWGGQPSGRVLPVVIDALSVDALPPFVKSLTVLRPRGNVAAEVLVTLEQLLAKSRSFPQSFEELASLDRAGRVDVCKKALSALRSRPERADAARAVGIVHLYDRRSKDALQHLEMARESQMDSWRSHYYLALALASQAPLRRLSLQVARRAIELCDTAIELDRAVAAPEQLSGRIKHGYFDVNSIRSAEPRASVHFKAAELKQISRIELDVLNRLIV